MLAEIALKAHTHTLILARLILGQEMVVKSADSVEESANSATDSVIVG